MTLIILKKKNQKKIKIIEMRKKILMLIMKKRMKIVKNKLGKKKMKKMRIE